MDTQDKAGNDRIEGVARGMLAAALIAAVAWALADGGALWMGLAAGT